MQQGRVGGKVEGTGKGIDTMRAFRDRDRQPLCDWPVLY